MDNPLNFFLNQYWELQKTKIFGNNHLKTFLYIYSRCKTTNSNGIAKITRQEFLTNTLVNGIRTTEAINDLILSGLIIQREKNIFQLGNTKSIEEKIMQFIEAKTETLNFDTFYSYAAEHRNFNHHQQISFLQQLYDFVLNSKEKNWKKLIDNELDKY